MDQKEQGQRYSKQQGFLMNQSLKGGRREGIKSGLEADFGICPEIRWDFLFCDREEEEWVGINTPFVEEGWTTEGDMPKASGFHSKEKDKVICYWKQRWPAKPWS